VGLEQANMKIKKTIEQILETEFCLRFVQLMKYAMVNSYHKYGPMADNYKTEKTMDAIGNLKKRLEKYEETGNTEFLVDVANFAMIEFQYPQHKNGHYEATCTGVCETVGMGVNEIRDFDKY